MKKVKKGVDRTKTLCYNSAVVRTRQLEPPFDLGVAQMVARYLGVVEAASSNLVTQTK